MITPEQIREKARGLHGKSVAAWLAGDADFFPRRLPADLKIPASIAEAVEAVEDLRRHSKEQKGSGYRIEWERRRSRSHGNNDFPVALHLDSMEDLCSLIGELPRWVRLQEVVATVGNRLPALEPWLRQSGNWRKLLDVEAQHRALIAIVEFFIANPRPNVFARQISVASSKVIENHKRFLADWLDQLLPPSTIDPRYDVNQFEARYGLKYARPHFLIRSLDSELSKRIGIPFDECSLPAEILAMLPIGDASVFLIENKVSVLTMPNAANSLALGGLGSGVTQLCDVPWLHDRPITYWGDLDSAGFEILHRLRTLLPAVQSILMDEPTVRNCIEFTTEMAACEPREGLKLTTGEFAAYSLVCRRGLRIEQEHIPDLLLNVELRSVIPLPFAVFSASKKQSTFLS